MEIIASVSLNFIFFFFFRFVWSFSQCSILFSFLFFYNALIVSSREQMFWVLFLCFNEYKTQSALPSLLVLFALPQPCWILYCKSVVLSMLLGVYTKPFSLPDMFLSHIKGIKLFECFLYNFRPLCRCHLLRRTSFDHHALPHSASLSTFLVALITTWHYLVCYLSVISNMKM